MSPSFSFANELATPTLWHARFEDQRVGMVLKAFQLSSFKLKLLDDQEALWGDRRLTFDAFYRRFPDFPIVFLARSAIHIPDLCPPGELFRHFEANFLAQWYAEAEARCEKLAEGRPIGLVVAFDRVRGGLVLHNGVYETRGSKFIHDMAEDQPPHRLTLESFTTLLRFLARGDWEPGNPIKPERQPRRLQSELPLTPDMIRRLGVGPAVILWAWLLKVRTSTSAHERIFLRRIRADQVAINASQKKIAYFTGLSREQVKRAMATLRKNQIVLGGQKNAVILADSCFEQTEPIS
jgi:hypothetical protein